MTRIETDPDSGKTFAIDESGGRKEIKPYAFSLLPWAALWEVAKLFYLGAQKYEQRNWEKGYDWSLSYDALMRHLTLWWEAYRGGEDIDEETGIHHLACVVWHGLVLLTFVGTHPRGDDRPGAPSPGPSLGTETP